MLTHETLPLVIAKKIDSALQLGCPNVDMLDFPNVDYCRKCKGIVRIIAKTSAAHEAALELI